MGIKQFSLDNKTILITGASGDLGAQTAITLSEAGANVVITKGLKIGKHSVVAAGSVVTRDVEDYCVVAGVPAKIIKRYNIEKHCWYSQSE